MTPEQKLITQKMGARHALGLDEPKAKGRSYRNRYYTGASTVGFFMWLDMVKAGDARGSIDPGQSLFRFELTKQGALKALEPGESLDTEDFP